MVAWRVRLMASTGALGLWMGVGTSAAAAPANCGGPTARRLASASTPDLTLAAPLPRQVVQTDGDGGAAVLIAGTAAEDVVCIEVRADLEAGQLGAAQPWQKLDGRSVGRSFTGSLRLALGGWYTIAVRGWTASGPGQATIVDKVGVGEVFVAAGQSNSTNFGFARQTPSDDHISAWNGSSWQFAADPQILATTDGSTGGSPWPPMASALYAAWHVPIAILSVGWGGTSVEQWQPGGWLYPRLASALQFLGKNGARAVLWHQGEADTLLGTAAAVYAQNLRNVINQSRADAGYPLPWFIAGVSYIGPDHTPQQPAVRAGEDAVIDHQLNFAGPVTDDLLGDNRGPDGIHFSGPGLQVHGARWAAVLEQAITPR